MGIDLFWRDAAGELRDAAYDESSAVSDAVNRLREDSSQRDLLVSTIGPYWDTRFTSGQARQLLREFELLRQQSRNPEQRIGLGRISSILRAADGSTGEWLEFIGDFRWMEMYLAGRDQLGRRVHLAFIPQFSGIQQLAFPEGVFVILIAGPTQDASVDLIYLTAEMLLKRGAAYVMCWGAGANRFEDIVDEAVAMRSIDYLIVSAVITTAHENESIEEVLEFATTVAVPADTFAGTCEDVVLVFHENVNWYNEAHILLEDMLTGGAA